jgi:hypothetical protein
LIDYQKHFETVQRWRQRANTLINMRKKQALGCGETAAIQTRSAFLQFWDLAQTQGACA